MSQVSSTGAGSVIRDVNYINIFMQPSTNSGGSPSKNIISSYDERHLEDAMEQLIDHTTV
jgi:hypothetical protein